MPCQSSEPHLDGQVFGERFLEAAGDAAVLDGVDQGGGTQAVVQQVGRQAVALLALQVQRLPQGPHQLGAVRQQLVAVQTGHLPMKTRLWRET